MPYCSIFVYLLSDKVHPEAAEISTILHQNNFINWGVLGVLVSYTIARGIKIVVGGSLGGFRVFLGCLGGSTLVKGVLLDSYNLKYKSPFPLWKSSLAPDLVLNTT